MTARPSEGVAATERESSEPVLGLYGECTHSLARTMPALTMIDRIGHASLCEGVNGVSTDAINWDHPRNQLLPLLTNIPRSSYGFRHAALSSVRSLVQVTSRVQTRLYHGRRSNSPTAAAMGCSALGGRTRATKGARLAALVRDRVNSIQATTEGGGGGPVSKCPKL
jgi:hypothetical protein